jgi:hypothetical protein
MSPTWTTRFRIRNRGNRFYEMFAVVSEAKDLLTEPTAAYIVMDTSGLSGPEHRVELPL